MVTGVYVGGPFDGRPCFSKHDEDAPLVETLFQLEVLQQLPEEESEDAERRVERMLGAWDDARDQYAQAPFGTAALYRREPGTARFTFVRYLSLEEFNLWAKERASSRRSPES
jgi:hypothetical protein